MSDQPVTRKNKRLMKEIKEWHDVKDDEEFKKKIEVEIEDEDIDVWKGFMYGESDSPYKGGKFPFTVKFDNDYPFKPPLFTFDVKIYHPGINDEGQICMEELRSEKWKPSMKMIDLLRTIRTKLNDPASEGHFVPEIAKVLQDDPATFNAKVKEWIKRAERSH